MDAGLTSLFVGSVLASTIMPGGVEVLLYFLADSGKYTFHVLLIIATLGNTIGGVVTFFMGRLLYSGLTHVSRHTKVERFFKPDEPSLSRVRKWGLPALLLTWLPVIGDPIGLAGGYLGLPIWPSIALIALGKFGRYLVLLWLIM